MEGSEEHSGMSDRKADEQGTAFFEVWQGGRKVAGRIEDPERAQRYALIYSQRYPAEGEAEVRRAGPVANGPGQRPSPPRS